VQVASAPEAGVNQLVGQIGVALENLDANLVKDVREEWIGVGLSERV